MFEVIVAVFIIYLMVVLFPLFLVCGAVMLAACVATFTWIKDKLLNQ